MFIIAVAHMSHSAGVHTMQYCFHTAIFLGASGLFTCGLSSDSRPARAGSRSFRRFTQRMISYTIRQPNIPMNIASVWNHGFLNWW